jgi:hypothetical protein
LTLPPQQDPKDLPKGEIRPVCRGWPDDYKRPRTRSASLSNDESRLSRLLAWGKAELYGTPRAAILLLIDRASRRDELKALLYAIGDVPRHCLLLVATIVSVIFFIKVEMIFPRILGHSVKRLF